MLVNHGKIPHKGNDHRTKLPFGRTGQGSWNVEFLRRKGVGTGYRMYELMVYMGRTTQYALVPLVLLSNLLREVGT